MKYYNVKSIFSANKEPLSLREESPSFFIAPKPSKPYIEPTFEKVEFEIERPTILLVSAVGVTGKTALAEKLSHETNLPLLDLGKHKPVGDNTLTGLLTRAFDIKDISAVLQGLSSGSYGVIIDGIDEGRSKTTGKAFEAFLDDVARLCEQSSTTSFFILGRPQILEDCWLYLTDKGIPTGLITILPFTVDAAKEYIDTFTGGRNSAFAAQYLEARDTILQKLSRAFAGHHKAEGDEFLSFIGYPPVLDAIVTLLTDVKNYKRLLDDLGDPGGSNVEVSLLHRIAQYILQRERDLKVIPNIVKPLLQDAPKNVQSSATAAAFTEEEQCIRLLGHCLGKTLQLKSLGDITLDEKYEAQLTPFLPEHPFITGPSEPPGPQFRNAVFEAFALATIMASRIDELEPLINEYLSSHKHSYHLVYMLDTILTDHHISIGTLGPLFAAAMEFRSVNSIVELHVNGPDWDFEVPDQGVTGDIEIEIEILIGEGEKETQNFEFQGKITPNSRLSLGSRLADAFISVPCQVKLGGTYEIELTSPVEITAKLVMLDAKALVLRSKGQQGDLQEVIVESQELETGLETIKTNGIPLTFALADMTGVSYPVIQYAQKKLQPPNDPLLRQKYFRLKRILMEFRSHSRGGLAKYKHKIEHMRVLKNEIGSAVLKRLVADKILFLKGNMYHLEPSELSTRLGVSWQDLRKGQLQESLIGYLNAIV
jgi:hypothetical protein